jgi:glycosyltransferase involved in cell wall biosynthesis
MLGAMTDIDRHVILAEDGPLVSQLEDCGATVEILPLAERTRNLHRESVGRGVLAGPQAAESVAYSVRLAARLRKLRPDIVHTNSLKAALYGGVAARLARIPVVVQINDRIANDYLPESAVKLVQCALRWLPDAIVANSQTTLATTGRAPLLRAGPAKFLIYPPAAADPPLAGQRGSTLRIGMVGRLGPTKGQHVFVKALAQALPDLDESVGGWEAMVVGAALFGEEEERYADDLTRLVADLGLEGRVSFLGFRDDIAGELSRMHILVHASVNPEPFGLVVVEAMAAGLPVIAASPGGPAEVIEDGVTGLLYQAGDVEGLASALRRLAGDPKLREKLGGAAKVRAAEFSPAMNAANMRKVYRQVTPTSGSLQFATL